MFKKKVLNSEIPLNFLDLVNIKDCVISKYYAMIKKINENHVIIDMKGMKNKVEFGYIEIEIKNKCYTNILKLIDISNCDINIMIDKNFLLQMKKI